MLATAQRRDPEAAGVSDTQLPIIPLNARVVGIACYLPYRQSLSTLMRVDLAFMPSSSRVVPICLGRQSR